LHNSQQTTTKLTISGAIRKEKAGNIKTVFIIGASSGIGAATARAAHKAGWNVALMARRQEKVDELVKSLGEDRALAIPGDVTDLSSLEKAVQTTVDKFGGIDAAFANAGTGISKPGTEQGDPEEWKRLIDLNIMGLLYTTRAVLPELKKTKGSLVLTGSVAGKKHIKGSIYGASKWFVHGYAGNMAEEMQEWGGRCTVIAPGMVNTDFFDSPKPDALQPEDVADAVVFAITADPRNAVREVFLMPNKN
jgi:NADP-dependent 3-hydroxy acid dehydrogenase YdfG